MTNEQILEREWLIARNDEYRRGDDTVSDPEFDARYERFCEKYPDDILAQRAILEELSGSGEKEKLDYPMFSLNKKKTVEEIRAWVKKNGLPDDVGLIATCKFDGISILNDEEKPSTHTRGDGVVGFNKTEHFQHMGGTNFFSLENKEFYSIGEAIMPRKNWVEFYENRINPKTGKLYKTARNTVGGMINTDKPNADDLSRVVYIRYGMVSKNGKQLSKIEQIEHLNLINTVEVQYEIVRANDPNLAEILDALYKKWKVDFDIDGIVLDINDASIREELGREENNNPKWAIAYKSPDWAEIANTTVTSIKIGISKKGELNPVVNINPVVLGGAVVSKCTGYNMRYILDNNISVGCKINMIRSGDVIPKHLETTEYDKTVVDAYWSQLTTCPCCDSPIFWNNTEVNLVCSNYWCSDRQKSKLISFFATIETKDFGEGEITKLFNKGYKTPESILNITADELLAMDGWATKSVNSLLKQFEGYKTNGLPLAVIMKALDLFGGVLGEKLSQKIFDEYDGADDFREEDCYLRLCKIDGVSNITAMAFTNAYSMYTQDYKNLPIAVSYVRTPKKAVIGDKYSGFAVCMTGFRDSDLEEHIVAYGGKIVSGVSKKTTHLLVKDFDSGSSKIKSAYKLQENGHSIHIMTKSEFLSL